MFDIRRKSIVVIAGCAVLACAAQPRPAPPSPEIPAPSTPANRFDDLYRRTETRFNLAEFYKPDPRSESDLPAAIAPLLVVERPDPGFGASRQPAREASPLVLKYAAGEVHFGPVLRRQVLFYWQPPEGKPDAKPSSSADLAPGPTAVRFTLTELGAPMIVEILPRGSSDSTELLVVFVSRSVEDAAQRQYGAPLPQRRFACEPAIDFVPDVVVAGVFNDSPDLSGPYLYFASDWQTLTTVICRCSPSQVGDFVVNEYYRLAPLTQDAVLDDWLSFQEPSPLTELLRLPDALP